MSIVRNIKGTTLIELLIAASISAALVVPATIGLLSFLNQGNIVTGKLDSKITAARVLLQIQKDGRLATGCPGSSTTRLQCLVEFPSGAETLVYEYDPQEETLTYFRGITGDQFVWELSGVQNFAVCNGRELSTGTCFDGDETWVNTPMTASDPVSVSNFFRVKLTFQNRRKIGREEAVGEIYNMRSGFYTRNVAGSVYSWMPAEGGL